MRPLPEVEHAAELLRRGGLVAFPTETVYGLGANALDREAVLRIYKVKGRPSTSPLIVHVDSAEAARALVLDWPDAAEDLAAKYWPGPLTLVLKKRSAIPAEVTAGLPTVGVRVPDHPIALALLRAARIPLAAPSANRFTQLSPTTAAHVRAALGSDIDYVLDGGPCQVGIESAVVSLAGEAPVLLRPGMIDENALALAVGGWGDHIREGPHASPGMHPKHYSPATPLFLGPPAAADRGAYLWWSTPLPAAKPVAMPSDPVAYAAKLYGVLHELDREGWDTIAVELPPDEVAWSGIRDRLQRAARNR